MFKQYKKIFIVMLFLVLISPIFYIVSKLSYRYKVDKVFAETVRKDLQSISNYSRHNSIIGFLGEDIITVDSQNNPSNSSQWGEKLARLENKDIKKYKGDILISEPTGYLETSNDGGKTWNNLITFNDFGFFNCHAAVVYKENFYCIVYATNLNVFDKNGKAKKYILSGNSKTEEELAVYKKDNNKLIIVWNDHRAQIPLPTFSPPYFYGPYLIMAGELNLDTLEFKEHVIGYDKYTLRDLFGNNFESK